MKKMGVVFASSSLVILYSDPNQRFDLLPQSDCRLQAARVKTRGHSKCLASIPEIKIEKLIRIVHEVQGGREIEQNLKKIESEFAVYTEEGLSLNRVSDRDLARQKQLMELTFEKNKVGIDHPDKFCL